MNRRQFLATTAAGLAFSNAIVPGAIAAEPPSRPGPIGEGKGIHPGRVVWVHDPKATDWKGPEEGHWWDADRVRQKNVSLMMERAVCALTGAATAKDSWDRLFRHFNAARGKKDAGYQAGEKIVIKPNWVGMIVGEKHVDLKTRTFVSRHDYMNTAPQMIHALLAQLTALGIRPADITVIDTLACIVNEFYEPLGKAFPGVRFADYAGDESGGTQTEDHAFLDNAFNQYYSIDSAAYGYDANGNLASNPWRGQTYQWDAFNRLVQASAGGQPIGRYVYDATGRRLRKGAGGQWTDYAWDGWQILEQRLSGGANPERQWVYGVYIDEPLVMDVNGNGDSSCVSTGDSRYFYHQNLNYSVLGLTDANGVLVEAYHYTPYGRHIVLSDGDQDGAVEFDGTDAISAQDAPSPLGNPYLFTGRQLDGETGLYYNRNRILDSSMGRFISRDTLLKDGPNLYHYVKNNSISHFDSMGLYTLGDAERELIKEGKCKEEITGDWSDQGFYTIYICDDNEKFDKWLKLEKSLGSWWTGLPKCPPKLCLDSEGKPICTNKAIWTDPNDFNRAVLKKYHPGASYEMRTRSGVKGAPHGNQCTYDKEGKMITSIPAAGSADLMGPNNGLINHYSHDVVTYDLARKLGKVKEYYSVRPIW